MGFSKYFEYSVELVRPESGSALWLFDDFAEIHRQPDFFSGNQRMLENS